MSAQQTRQPIVVTHDGGVQFSAQIRQHRVIVDQPERGGGADAAPAPIELLGASLGTCVALYVQRYCASRGLSHEGMRIEVQQFGAQNPNRIGQFDVKVVLPSGLPDEHLPMLERVARSCPAHGTLTHAADVNVALALGTPATVAA